MIVSAPDGIGASSTRRQLVGKSAFVTLPTIDEVLRAARRWRPARAATLWAP
jgi:hypothetical protein